MIKKLLLGMLLFSLNVHSKGMRIDYYGADWCGPCNATKPHLRKYKAEKPNVKVNIYDVDKEVVRSKANQIRVVPTFIFFLDGKEEGRETGSMTYAKISCLANKYFKNNDEDCDLPHNKVNNDH